MKRVIIEKKDLIPNRWYISEETDHRGSLYVGIWDKEKEKFLCIDTSQWPAPRIDEIPYIFDESEDYPFVTFSPITLIPDPNDVQAKNSAPVEEWPENDC